MWRAGLRWARSSWMIQRIHRPAERPDRDVDARRQVALNPEIAPRVVFIVTLVVFIGFASNALVRVIVAGPGAVRLTVVIIALVLALVLQLGLFSRPNVDVRNWRGYAALVVSTALLTVPFLGFPSVWGGVQGFIGGNALLVLPTLAGLAITAIVATIFGVFQAQLNASPITGAYIGIITVLLALSVYGLTRLRTLVAQLQTVRTQLADAAVTTERLRFVREVEDLLDHRLSALGLKAELASRLTSTDADRAKTEIAEILSLSRQTLDEVRSVARGYREVPLDSEVNAARAVLSAADMDVTVEASLEDPGPRARTAIATIIREGATNVLRHSDATRCAISLRQRGSSIRLEITNDGASTTGPVIMDRALGNLRDLLAADGGELTAESREDGTFVLQAQIVARPDHDAEMSDDPTLPEGMQPVVPPRFTPILVAAVIIGYFLTTESFALHQWLDSNPVPYPPIGPVGVLVATVCLAITTLIWVGIGWPGGRPRTARSLWLALVVQAVAVFLPVVLYRDPTIAEAGFLAASAILVIRRPLAGWAAFGLVAGAMGGLQAIYTNNDPVLIQYGLAAVINHGLVVFALSQLQSTVVRLHRARTGLADLAVTRERLRLARDLHDLVGYSLSTMTLKSELAHRLITTRPERARHQIAEVLAISRLALADVRSVSTGYRDMSLDDECASARSVLDAAGIEANIRTGHGELPEHVGTVLATVLREGLTNMLRHSKAEHCAIITTHGGGRATITITNDGVAESPADTPAVGGTGLRNLAERVADLSGELTATREVDDTFRLHTWVPLNVDRPNSEPRGRHWERLRGRLSRSSVLAR